MTRSRGVTLIDCALLGRQRLLGSGKSTEACLAQLFKSTFRDKPVEKKVKLINTVFVEKLQNCVNAV